MKGAKRHLVKNESLSTLEDYGVITRSPHDKTFSSHKIFQDIIRQVTCQDDISCLSDTMQSMNETQKRFYASVAIDILYETLKRNAADMLRRT